MNRKVTILGAGLVGSVLAVMMRKRGYEVDIYERRPDMRVNTIGAGRSINLAMSNRGWKALEIAGLRTEIESIAIPMYGRFLHQQDGTTAFQAYGKNEEAIYSVSRGELNKKLMDLAESYGANIFFEHKSSHVDVANNRVNIEKPDGSTDIIQCDLLFGADGAFSSLRTAYSYMDRTNFSQYYIEAGYKELFIPPGPNSSFLMEKNALHIWPRGNFMMIALPNPDGNFTCTLFFPFEGNPSFESVKTEEEIKHFFETYFPDAISMMPTYIEDYKRNPVSSLITVKIEPYNYQDKSLLIGDAAHAIVPFYGQGLNAGLEDCSVLWELMDNHGDDWMTIFNTFSKRRKPNGDAVAELALQNFIEMRDKVADPIFLERKKIEKDLGKRYPEIFNSVYEMVSFSHTPYAFAWESGAVQDVLLEKIMQHGDYFAKVNDPEFLQMLDNWMADYKDQITRIKHM